MKETDFIRQYVALRRLQRGYFKTRTLSALEAARVAERALDAKAREILCDPSPGLFIADTSHEG
jgi:hypothetical protein